MSEVGAGQSWRRLGHVFVPDGAIPWMASHATYPTPLVLPGGEVRVFFSPRDATKRSSISSLDLAIRGGSWAIVRRPQAPLLEPGSRGAFDDSGVTVGAVVPYGEQIFVYYVGWCLGTTVPFRNFIGLAFGETFDAPLYRASVAPVIDRSPDNPFSLSYPWVLRTDGKWRMWFGSTLAWGPQGGEMYHTIKSASSEDGVRWRALPDVAVPLQTATPEYALSRPCVIHEGGRWKMWYSRKSPDYRLGYAESDDGEMWARADDAVELVGPVGAWESESTEYTAVFDHAGERYMLYNGNGFGRTGFGLAILDR